MAKNSFLELEQYRKKVAQLEKEVAREVAKQHRKLLALPGRFGFRTVGDMVGALQAAAKGAGSAFQEAKTKSVRKRAKITPEIKARVKSLVAKGRTGAAIAKEAGISLPSVQNIKRELGLVRKK